MLHRVDLNSELSNIKFWQKEFYDIRHIIEMGTKKHGENTWLAPGYDRKWHDNMFHHLARSYGTYGKGNDAESGLSHLLHLACNALMLYTRIQRGLEK